MVKIGVLTNKNCEGFTEDELIIKKISNIFDVDTISVYDSDKINKYNLIIRRNTWEEDSNKIFEFRKNNRKITQLIEDKKILSINLNGLDWYGKKYLCDLYNMHYNVIPTIESIKDVDKISNYNKFVSKDIWTYSSIGQQYIDKSDIENSILNGKIIQPVIDFISEVQFYFIEDRLQYALEYSPCKYPLYPRPKLYNPSNKELDSAVKFAKLTHCIAGVQRIDFLRQTNGNLILLEIEDNSPHLSLIHLKSKLRERFLNEYMNSVSKYLKKNNLL